VLLDECGADVGTLQHSRMFAAAFVHSLKIASAQMLKDMLLEPLPVLAGLLRPFAVNADKATFVRRTNQIVGLITFVNGEIKAIFLGAHVVNREDQLSDQLFEAVTEFTSAENLSTRWSGGAFDGRYILAGVAAQLHSKLNLSPGTFTFR